VLVFRSLRFRRKREEGKTGALLFCCCFGRAGEGEEGNVVGFCQWFVKGEGRKFGEIG
jgi:hypothetical protein